MYYYTFLIYTFVSAVQSFHLQHISGNRNAVCFDHNAPFQDTFYKNRIFGFSLVILEEFTFSG